MKNRVLPNAVSTSEFYLYALLEQAERLADGVEALVAAVSVASPASPPDGEWKGLDEERLITLLSSIKGIGDVTARRIVESYKQTLDE
jgi:hypothetical protein